MVEPQSQALRVIILHLLDNERQVGAVGLETSGASRRAGTAQRGAV
jgi:hypothetical protein